MYSPITLYAHFWQRISLISALLEKITVKNDEMYFILKNIGEFSLLLEKGGKLPKFGVFQSYRFFVQFY